MSADTGTPVSTPAIAAASQEDALEITLPARPYPGLRPFDAAEWPIFFGRERMVDAVIARLVKHQFIVVHGDSGSGKSSLIRAGVLPSLHQEQARGGQRWRTCIALPRGGPMRNIATALAALDGRADDADRLLALRRALNQGKRAPAAIAELMLANENDHLCLLIDQFEELFEHARLPNGEAEARALTDALVALAEAPPRGLYMALTMRSEYLGACARFTGLAEATNLHQYLLPPMSTGDLLRAICEPARLYGGAVAPDLAERLAAHAAGSDGLPLVQHALMLMHREATHGDAQAEGWRLGQAHVSANGLGAMLSRHADEVAASAQPATLSAQYPRLVEDLMRALTAINAEGHAVRRPQPLASLAAVCGVDCATLRPVVDAFRADGVSFMTPRMQGTDSPPLADETWIDIGHEALIRCWRSLAESEDGWLVREFRNGLVWRSMLVQAESFERAAGNVLSPTTAEERQRWMLRRTPAWAERYGGGWTRVQALIDASEARRIEDAALRKRELATQFAAERSRRGMWVATGVASLAVALLGLAGWSIYLKGKAQDELRATLVQSVKISEIATTERAVAESESARVTRLLARMQQLMGSAEKALTQAKQQARSPAERATLDRLEKQIWATGLDEAPAGAAGPATRPAQAGDVAPGAVVGAAIASGANPADAAPAADPAPRVYVHIGNNGQRLAAASFITQLGAGTLGRQPISALGPQLVAGQRNDGVLRCFRPADCGDDAQRLLKQANALLASPTLTLQDLSSRYVDNPPRPHHYEVWFGNAPVALSRPAQAGGSATAKP